MTSVLWLGGKEGTAGEPVLYPTPSLKGYENGPMVETPEIQSSPDLTVKVSLQHNQQSSGTKTEDGPSAVWTRARHTANTQPKKVQRGLAYDLIGVGASNDQTKGRFFSSKGQG